MNRGSLFRNVTTLVAAQAVIKVLNFAVAIAVVRYLGVQELGRYAYVIAFAFPFGTLAEFGLAAFSIREISKDRACEPEVVAVLQRTLFLLAGGVGIAMILLAALIPHDALTTTCIIILALSNLISAAVTPYLVGMTAREELHHLSLFRVGASALGTAATVTVLLWGGGVLALFAAAAAANIVVWMIGRYYLGEIVPTLPVPWSAVRFMLRRALPFGALLLGFALYYRVDIVMLRWLRDESEVGLYSAAYRFVDAVILLAATLGTPFYPRLSNMMGQNIQGVRDLLETTWRPMFALGLPVAIGTFFVARPLILTLFGREFEEAAFLLQILIWGSLPILLINIPSHALNAADRVWLLAGVFGLSALVNVAVNFLLIPRWGAVGAGMATVLCEWLNLVVIMRLVSREFRISFAAEGLWRYLLAAAGMALVLWLASGTGLAVEILLGVLCYAGGLLVLGYLRSADMLAIRRLLAQ